MAKPTPEVLAKRKAKAKRSTMTNRIRVALANGNEKEGYRLASLLGEDIFLSRLPKEYQSPAEPWFVAKESELRALSGQSATSVSNEPTDQIKAPSGANSIFSDVVAAILVPKAIIAAKEFQTPSAALVETESQITTEGFKSTPEFPPDDEIVIVPQTPIESTICVRGWPVSQNNVEIWGACRNPNLMVALLADGRKVSVYQGRFRKFQLRERVNITLEQDFLDGAKQGDPCYVAHQIRGNIW